MSAWEFAASVQGYIDAHVGDEPGMKAEEADAVWDLVQARMGRA